MRRVLLTVLALAGAIATSGCATARSTEPVVVMISLDGLAGFYMDDPLAEMPTLRELAGRGASSGRMRASNPSVTWPTHTSLVTGVDPARHGVVGNNYFDRATGKPVALISDPEYDKEQIVRAPTIYDLAKAASLTTAAIRWPASRNAPTLDWQVPAVSSPALLRQATTPALIAEAERAGVWNEGELVEPGKSDKRVITDQTCTELFKLILREHRPNLALLHLVDIDHEQHLHGPRSAKAYDAIRASDARVRGVWDAMEQNYAGPMTIVVVSDHGFSPINKLILPNVILREKQLIEVKGLRVVGGPVRVVAQGGAAMVYVVDPAADRAAIVARVKEAFAGVEGIHRVATAEEDPAMGVATPEQDPHAPDVFVFAKEGYAFGDTAAGALPFNEKPERKGTHGHDAALPNLHATFVAAGSGIKSGTTLGAIRNTEVAPIVSRLLGLPMPVAADNAIAPALANP